MAHPRIEEVSDSDMSDPSEGDIDDFAEADILRARTTTTTTTGTSSSKPPPPPSSSSPAIPSTGASLPAMIHPSQSASTAHIQPSDIKGYQMLYPVYFDASRTRRGGRRVPSSLAVPNPLARTIAGACASLRLRPVLEAHRTHPRDWANPGRVRVQLSARAPDGDNPNPNPYASAIKNKHHLYVLVARYLRENPTTEDCEALWRMRGPGMPGDDDDDDDDDESVDEDGKKKKKKKWPRPAIPRGWEKKMGDLLPAYSAAMSGGGVSENAFREMMKEMQGAGGAGGGGGMPGLPGGITPEMMNMLGGMGGLGGAGGGEASGGGGGGGNNSGGGGKKGKKGKGKA
ncbi:signal recognition particle, SRP19 subunit [Biscogniauxia marginata]|nr:signal recognition particle, SRP19 subunit [Biscogniauxia marginata]